MQLLTEEEKAQVYTLCVQYKESGNQQHLLEIYKICKPMADHIIRNCQFLLLNSPDNVNADMLDVAYLHLKKVADWEKTQPDNFTHLYFSTLKSAIFNEYKCNIKRHAKRTFKDITEGYYQETHHPYIRELDNFGIIKMVTEMLEGIPAANLKIFVRFLRGESYKDIASAEDTTVNAATLCVSRIRSKLRAIPQFDETSQEVQKMDLPHKAELSGDLMEAIELVLANKPSHCAAVR